MKLALVKLGQNSMALDEMVINRDSVSFYEELKEDSKVVKTIAEDKAKK